MKKHKPTQEEILTKKCCETISHHLVHEAAVLAREKQPGGWLCGTYLTSVKRNCARKIRLSFTLSELKLLRDYLKDGMESPSCLENEEQLPALIERMNQFRPTHIHVNDASPMLRQFLDE